MKVALFLTPASFSILHPSGTCHLEAIAIFACRTADVFGPCLSLPNLKDFTKKDSLDSVVWCFSLMILLSTGNNNRTLRR